MKRNARADQVDALTARIDGLTTKMAKPHFSHDAAKTMDRQRQRLHAAMKILNKPAK